MGYRLPKIASVISRNVKSEPEAKSKFYLNSIKELLNNTIDTVLI